MPEAVVGSTVMIVFVLILRKFFYKNFCRRFLYGLWGFVLLRLTVFTLFSLPRELVFYQRNLQEIGRNPVLTEVRAVRTGDFFVSAGRIAFWLWMAGMVAVLLFRIIPLIEMWLYLKRERTAVTEKKKTELTVYTVSGISTPFLFGSAIYCPSELWVEKEKMRLVLWHETVHFKHLDPVWNVLRCAVTAVYWFHPLVWVAGQVSRQDAEYACDEEVISQMTEKEVQEYCKVLLEVASGQKFMRRGLYPKTGMASGRLSDRIKQMMGKQKPKQAAAFLAVCVMVVFAVASLPAEAAEKRSSEPAVLTGSEEGRGGMPETMIPTGSEGGWNGMPETMVPTGNEGGWGESFQNSDRILLITPVVTPVLQANVPETDRMGGRPGVYPAGAGPEVLPEVRDTDAP